MRKLTAEDMNAPILGVPFLSQVYLFADYQARLLYTGLADHGDAYLVGREEIQCVEHSREVGDLGWAQGASGTPTSSVAGSKTTGTKNDGMRKGVDRRTVVACIIGLVGIWGLDVMVN
jgi:hypothetical protein